MVLFEPFKGNDRRPRRKELNKSHLHGQGREHGLLNYHWLCLASVPDKILDYIIYHNNNNSNNNNNNNNNKSS